MQVGIEPFAKGINQPLADQAHQVTLNEETNGFQGVNQNNAESHDGELVDGWYSTLLKVINDILDIPSWGGGEQVVSQHGDHCQNEIKTAL